MFNKLVKIQMVVLMTAFSFSAAAKQVIGTIADQQEVAKALTDYVMVINEAGEPVMVSKATLENSKPGDSGEYQLATIIAGNVVVATEGGKMVIYTQDGKRVQQ